jgi:hypothetical protein
MGRLFWLGSLLFACSFASKAQRAGEAMDTVAESEQGKPEGGDSIFVHFSGLVKDFNKVILLWEVNDARAGDYFIIERSTDAMHFETIGALRKSDNMDHYELTDMAPPNGNDFYRIEYSGQGGRVLYSRSLQMSLSGDVDFKFYPNPVDKLFIIRTQHTVDIQVIDAIGSIRLSKRLQPGIQVINISSLEKGAYVLRVADKESNRIVSRQLLKN